MKLQETEFKYEEKQSEYQTEISRRKQGEFTINTFFSKPACAYVTHIIKQPHLEIAMNIYQFLSGLKDQTQSWNAGKVEKLLEGLK